MGRKKQAKRSYGTGTAFKRKSRDTWSISWRDEGIRRYEHGLADEATARKRLAVILGDRAAGKATRAKGGETLNQHAARWLAERDSTHASAYDDHKRWELHIQDALGQLQPNKVTPVMVKAFIKSTLKKVKPGTVKLVVALLSSLYSDLLEDGHAASNPCRSLSKKTRALLQSEH